MLNYILEFEGTLETIQSKCFYPSYDEIKIKKDCYFPSGFPSGLFVIA